MIPYARQSISEEDIEAVVRVLRSDFPESENYYQQAITLPLYVGLTEQQVDYITQTISEIL